MKAFHHSSEDGFTLIELLIVIIVLGILAGIVLMATGSSKSDATHSACKTDFRSVELAAEAVYSQTALYPTAQSDLLISGGKGGTLKEFPTSTEYSLTYSSSGSSYTITVLNKAGTSVGTTKAACDSVP